MVKLSKIVFIVLLLAVGLQLTGVETAFCDDANPLMDSHGCQACSVTHHSAMNLEESALISMPAEVEFSMFHPALFVPQEPAFSILRPPILR